MILYLRKIIGFIISTLSANRAIPAGAILAATVLFSPGFAEETAPLSEDSLFGFAGHLYETGEYDAAITEYLRFVHHYPDDKRSEEAMFQAGMAHFSQGRYGRATTLFERVVREGQTMSAFAVEAAFMAAQSDRRRNDHASALSRLNALASRDFDAAIRDRALYGIGWILLERRDHSSAARAFSAISEQGEDRYRPHEITGRLETEPRELPVKRPAAAAVFSIVPGGGYLYTGRNRDAWISLVLVSGGAAASWESFDNDLNVLGAVLAIVSAGFYSGSIYGSMGAAHKYNSRVYEEFIDDLRSGRPDPAAGFSSANTPPPTPNTPGLVMRFPF